MCHFPRQTTPTCPRELIGGESQGLRQPAADRDCLGQEASSDHFVRRLDCDSRVQKVQILILLAPESPKILSIMRNLALHCLRNLYFQGI